MSAIRFFQISQELRSKANRKRLIYDTKFYLFVFRFFNKTSSGMIIFILPKSSRKKFFKSFSKQKRGRTNKYICICTQFVYLFSLPSFFKFKTFVVLMLYFTNQYGQYAQECLIYLGRITSTMYFTRRRMIYTNLPCLCTICVHIERYNGSLLSLKIIYVIA